MSYQHGYQQQPQQQQPYGGYQGGGGYPEPVNSTNPAMAIIAAVLALAAAAALTVAGFSELSALDDQLGAGFGDLPGEWKTALIIRFAAALVLLIGAIIVFARKLAGAIITVIGGLAGIAAVLLYPVLLSDTLGGRLDFGNYLEALFKFEETFLTFSAIALIVSPLALIVAILPPTLNYLKGSGSSSDFGGGYPQQPQQGW